MKNNIIISPEEWCEDFKESYQFLLHSDLADLRFFLTEIEKIISREKERELSRLDERVRKIPKTHQGDFWAWNYPAHWDDIFVIRVRSSFIVSLISLAEEHLKLIYDYTSSTVNVPIGIGALKGSIFQRVRRVLEVFANFTKPTQEVWDKIFCIYEIRNCIVHNSSYIESTAMYQMKPEKGKRLKAFIEKYQCRLSQGNHAEFSHEFCIFAIDTIEEFLLTLCEEYEALCDRMFCFKTKQ